MNKLNYFDGIHENNLTRAYLVLLKHSSHAFFTFFEYCRSKHTPSTKEKSISLIDYLDQGWEIETQKTNPKINTNYLLSVLITDTNLKSNDISIKSTERNAIYDGIITFGNNLTIVIENKPRSSNVWFEQLNPSRQNLAEDTIVYSNPAILEWKEIIKQLGYLLSIVTLSGYEKIMIDDFLSFIDETFPYLNPYESFHQCKGNTELLNRRINNLLKSIVLDENKVLYHKGWAYCILTPYQQIQQIGLVLTRNEKEWWLELSLYFADTQRQAISFYKSNLSIGYLENSDWDLYPNFHVSFMTSGLIWFKSYSVSHYLDFWKNNIGEIYQQKKDAVPNYIKWLADEKVIDLTSDKEGELQNKFYNTAMQTLNICPGFGIIYRIDSKLAEQLDKSGELKFLIAEKIKEGLQVIGIDASDLIKT